MEMVLNRQRKPSKLREKKVILCQFVQFMGGKCKFMKEGDNSTFRNVAELKEGALRHLSPYQCEICGKRFGKPFTKERHKRNKNLCVLQGGDKSSKPNFWLSPESQRAVSELEKAKGHDAVISAIHECIRIYGLGGESIRGIQNDRHSNPVNSTEAAWALESSGPVGPQETTIPNSTHPPPDPQSLSSLPLGNFLDETPGQASPPFSHDMDYNWWTACYSPLSAEALRATD